MLLPFKKPISVLSIPLWCDCDHLSPYSRLGMRVPFNPTVVRLRHKEYTKMFQSLNYFQSHCGAIATLFIHSQSSPNFGLSIPLWCDCDISRGLELDLPEDLSIPLWCDCDKDSKFHLTFRPYLSIPLWCDCDFFEMCWTLAEQQAFNPTVVRLRLNPLTSPNPLRPAFNPTVVRLRLGR